MSDSSRDAKSTKSESDKKQPETVQLTAEELRAIAGGFANPGPPPVSGKDVTGGPLAGKKS